MHFNAMTAGLALLITATVSAASPIASTDSTGLPYPLVVPTLTGTYNGRAFELNGTMNAVLAQLKAMYGPNEKKSSELVPRTTENKAQLLCIPVFGQDWAPAWIEDVNYDIQVMRDFDSVAGVNGRTCVNIAQRHQACTFLCNDNPYFIQPAFPYLSTYAQDLANRCNNRGYVGGQEFDTDNYNVIVRHCHCGDGGDCPDPPS